MAEKFSRQNLMKISDVAARNLRACGSYQQREDIAFLLKEIERLKDDRKRLNFLSRHHAGVWWAFGVWNVMDDAALTLRGAIDKVMRSRPGSGS